MNDKIGIKIHEACRIAMKHSPEILTGIGVAGSIAACSMLSGTNRLRALTLLYEQFGDPRYDVLIKRMTKSNNWLKQHGYPMKRQKCR